MRQGWRAQYNQSLIVVWSIPGSSSRVRKATVVVWRCSREPQELPSCLGEPSSRRPCRLDPHRAHRKRSCAWSHPGELAEVLGSRHHVQKTSRRPKAILEGRRSRRRVSWEARRVQKPFFLPGAAVASTAVLVSRLQVLGKPPSRPDSSSCSQRRRVPGEPPSSASTVVGS